MKLTSDSLKSIIASVVKEELSRVLPGLISEVLAESYLRKILSENQRPIERKNNKLKEMLEAQGDDPVEEGTPEPLQNTTKGIYTKNPLVKESRSFSPEISKLFSKENPFAHLYEDVVPLDQVEDSQGVNINTASDEFANMRELMERVERKSAEKMPMPVSPEHKMRELEMRRKMLDVPAIKTK